MAKPCSAGGKFFLMPYTDCQKSSCLKITTKPENKSVLCRVGTAHQRILLSYTFYPFFPQLPNASLAFGTVCSGLTLYQACMILPPSSMRKAERMMPIYFFPYMDFSPQTP